MNFKLIWLRGIIMPVVLIFLAFSIAYNAHCQPTQPLFTGQAGQERLELGTEETEFKLTPDYLRDVIYDAKDELKYIEIQHSDEKGNYKIKRKTPSGAVLELKEEDHHWKEIALELMNLKTGDIKSIKVIKVLDELVYNGSDFKIELEGRPAGTLWNGYNTPFRVVYPEDWAVVANKYKRYNRKTEQLEEIIYSPYSRILHQTQFVREGRVHLREDIDEALEKIKALKPEDVSLPILDNGDEWVAGVMERIALIEQSDPYEAIEFDKGKLKLSPFGRVYLLIFLNQDEAFAPTISSADAGGLMQWTRSTWGGVIRKLYPWAEFPEFEKGSTDHVVSIMASILLHNHNLELLNGEFNTDIMKWREPEHYLAACYNGGAGNVIRAMKWSNARGGRPGRWRDRLRRIQKTNETYYFLKKLDIAIKYKYGVR